MGEVKFSAVVLATSFRDEKVQLVKDASGQPLVIFTGQTGICYSLKSEKVLRALRSHAKQHAQRLNKNRIEEMIDELDAMAYEEGDTVVTHYRVAPYLTGYIYNLGASRFLQVTSDHVEVTTMLPKGVYFVETTNMLSAPDPEPKLDVKALLGWFNCSNADKVLLLAWLTFVVATPKAAKISTPILVVRAPAGSGKTFMCSQVIRQLVDPSAVASQALPKQVKDIAISGQNNHVLIYDNLRQINNELSDVLCQIATGSAISGRKLYTDDQEVCLELRGALVLNGIHNFVSESDLVSRCVNISLNPISSDQRRSETELSVKFDEELPSLMFTLHTIASRILAVKNNVEVSYKNRMADFSVWVAGLEAVLGQKPGAIQQAYRANVEQAKVAGIVDDSLFVSLSAFAKHYSKGNPWHGTPHALFNALTSQSTVSIGTDMPKNPSAMSRRLTTILDALASDGVYAKRDRVTNRSYDVWFESKCVKNAVDVASLPTTQSAETHLGEEVDMEELLT
ncbi:hypothetical protein [Aeromonas hydrophila]|uniref:hypothetical protein n=1 Tax=Aeromonas hydrophila TaxID=644 RepID=UPI002B46DC6E|nr:hypothetical protein [Aeromonas hydrophila]